MEYIGRQVKIAIAIVSCILLVLAVGCADPVSAPGPTPSQEAEKTPEPAATTDTLPSPDIMPSPSLLYTPTPSMAETATPSDSDGSISADKDDFKFSELAGQEFWFGSGVGAWNTTLRILPDGTFNGYYHDANTGDLGDGYPEGTMYECNFSGRFSTPIKVSEYEYSFKCETLVQEGVVGEEKIVDNKKIITSEPYGFDNADEFLLYLPGKSIDELPEGFLFWVDVESMDINSTGVLTYYGLYNVGGEQGFSASTY